MPLRRGDVSRVAELSLSLTLLLFCDARCLLPGGLLDASLGPIGTGGQLPSLFSSGENSHMLALKKKDRIAASEQTAY